MVLCLLCLPNVVWAVVESVVASVDKRSSVAPADNPVTSPSVVKSVSDLSSVVEYRPSGVVRLGSSLDENSVVGWEPSVGSDVKSSCLGNSDEPMSKSVVALLASVVSFGVSNSSFVELYMGEDDASSLVTTSSSVDPDDRRSVVSCSSVVEAYCIVGSSVERSSNSVVEAIISESVVLG